MPDVEHPAMNTKGRRMDEAGDPLARLQDLRHSLVSGTLEEIPARRAATVAGAWREASRRT
jgi:hypothetical protein